MARLERRARREVKWRREWEVFWFCRMQTETDRQTDGSLKALDTGDVKL